MTIKNQSDGYGHGYDFADNIGRGDSPRDWAASLTDAEMAYSAASDYAAVTTDQPRDQYLLDHLRGQADRLAAVRAIASAEEVTND